MELILVDEEEHVSIFGDVLDSEEVDEADVERSIQHESPRGMQSRRFHHLASGRSA